MKATKIKFTRDSRLSAKRVNKDEVISTINYANGALDIISDNFITRITNVDELVMTIKPLDPWIVELSFVAKNYDSKKNTNKLDFKMIGILNEHIIMTCENEIYEEEKEPGKRGRPPKKVVELAVKKADIPD